MNRRDFIKSAIWTPDKKPDVGVITKALRSGYRYDPILASSIKPKPFVVTTCA